MRIDLKGRTAFVTGAGRGIGKAIALSLGRAGAHVVCAYQQGHSAARSVVDELRVEGANAQTAQVDLTDIDAIRHAVSDLHGHGVDIDIVVNNAAVRPRTKLADISADEWDAVMATNVRGPFFLCQAVLPHMTAQQWGRIINISGVDAYRGSRERVHATTSKLAIVGLSRALATETALDGVTVNTVVPGLMDTARPRPEWYDDLGRVREELLKDIPMARMGKAEEVADACTFLASDQASYITGQELLVTGGAFPTVRQRAREPGEEAAEIE